VQEEARVGLESLAQEAVFFERELVAFGEREVVVVGGEQIQRGLCFQVLG
jgi:hypothetical protein